MTKIDASIVVSRLSPTIRAEIKDNDILKIAIHSIVTTSCYYPNGFQAFIEIVQDLEQGSRQMQRVLNLGPGVGTNPSVVLVQV